jgi:hypothetical protein
MYGDREKESDRYGAHIDHASYWHSWIAFYPLFASGREVATDMRSEDVLRDWALSL